MSPISTRTIHIALARFRASVTILILIASVLVCAPGAARAQGTCDGGWLPGDGIPGILGVVWCSTMWDPDGPGPRSPLLVVGGIFTVAGNAIASNIAVWDPQTHLWSALGSGMNGPVVALIGRPNGELIAGGQFASAGGVPGTRFIARWNGTSWSSLGAGTNSEVYGLTTLVNGDVIAGGIFTAAGGVAASRLAKWNGASWSALGSGVNDVVFILRTLPNGDVIAGGRFSLAGGVPANCIARWDGSAWSSFSTGLVGFGSYTQVGALQVLPNGDIVAAGYFNTAGGLPANNIARWDGTAWSPLANGVYDYAYDIGMMPNGDLIVGGDRSLSRWDGRSWSMSGTSLGSGTYSGGGSVYAFTSLPNGEVAVCGDFVSIGGLGTVSIAKWGGQSWSALGLGMNYSVRTLAPRPNGDLVAGGGFTIAGGGAVRFIAQRTGSTWLPVGLGVGSTGNESVRSISTLPNGDLIVLGSFATAGGVAAANIARWNGVAWFPLGSGISGSLVTQCTLPNGDIIAGGYFATAGGAPASNIARWNGTDWAPLGVGLSSWVEAVAALPNGDVVAGGSFALPGTNVYAGIARWNGVSWEAMGTPPFGVARALVVAPNGDLLAAFDDASHRAPVVRWNGITWSPLGMFSSGSVSALAVRPNGDVIAGGYFNNVDGVPAANIALWNGSGWEPFGSGVNSTVSALALLSDGDLVVGGNFNMAGGYLSSSVARYHFGDTNPIITHQPAPAISCPTSSAHFAIVAAGSVAFTYRWQVQTAPGMWASLSIASLPLTCGGAASSAAPTARETVIQIMPCPGTASLSPQQFRVRCVVTNACQSLTSGEAIYTSCPADFNCSGSLTAQDIFDYLNAWFALDPRADVNGSGGLDLQDTFDFLAAWFAGC